MYKVLFFLVAFASLFQSISSSCFGSDDEKNYRKIEDMMFKNDKENIKLLRDTFYPTNLHSKRIVSVTYKLLNAEVEATLTPSYISFYWLSSPVHLMINKKMLEGLSLRTYMSKESNLIIPLNISAVCPEDFEDIQQELGIIEKLKNSNNTQDLCNGNISILAILNNFTTNVSPKFLLIFVF